MVSCIIKIHPWVIGNEMCKVVNNRTMTMQHMYDVLYCTILFSLYFILMKYVHNVSLVTSANTCKYGKSV